MYVVHFVGCALGFCFVGCYSDGFGGLILRWLFIICVDLIYLLFGCLLCRFAVVGGVLCSLDCWLCGLWASLRVVCCGCFGLLV